MKSNNFDFKGLKKLGESIAFFRQQKGLTQVEFAKLLQTSQSAIARIEKGDQNLTAETISKINRVLEKNVVKLANPMLNLKVEGGKKLNGSVTVRSSKNSSVCLLYASLLNRQKTNIKNITVIEEVLRTIDVLKSLGVDINIKKQNAYISPLPIKNVKDIKIKANNLLLLIGVLSNFYGKFSIPVNFKATNFTGTLNSHLFSLEQLGFNFSIRQDRLMVDCTRKHGGEITMYESSDTATINCIFASVGIKEGVKINLASSNYQVSDVLQFLKHLGARVKGVGTTTLSINGGSKLQRVIEFNPITDPSESMFYISCGILTNSSIIIRKAPINYLKLELLKLKKMGFKYRILKRYKSNDKTRNYADIQTFESSLKALDEKMYARPFPGLLIDNLPYFVVIATQATGRTIVNDFVMTERAPHFTELNNLGADIILADNHRVFVQGKTQLKSADLTCSLALHPGNMILVAMLGAKGVSTLKEAYTLNAWYEGLFDNLNKLGASVHVLYEL